MRTKVILRRDGTILTEGLEGRGPECLEKVEALVKRLGCVKERTLKPEYELTESETQSERLHEQPRKGAASARSHGRGAAIPLVCWRLLAAESPGFKP